MARLRSTDKNAQDLFIVDLDADEITPPLAFTVNARPTSENDEYHEPPLYPPCSSCKVARYARVDVFDPPHECYFIVPRLNFKNYCLRDELAEPVLEL